MNQIKASGRDLVRCQTPTSRAWAQTFEPLYSSSGNDFDQNFNIEDLNMSKSSLDWNMMLPMTNASVVLEAMTETDSTRPNRSATWPQIKEFARTREAAGFARSTCTQEELQGYYVSSRLVRSPSSSCQSMTYWDHGEEPGGCALGLYTESSWESSAQSSDADCINNRSSSGVQARGRPSADTTPRLQLGIIQEKQFQEPTKAQSHDLVQKSARGSKRVSPVHSEAIKQLPERTSGNEGLYKRRKLKDNERDEGHASYQEDPSPGSYDDTHFFACPFYRRSPLLHKDCMNRKLTRIRDVKQHIMRRHIRTAFYCPTCYESYPSSRLRDIHITSRCCEPQPPQILDTLESNSKEVQDLKSYRATNSLTPEEKWHEIWHLLFREEPSGKSAFLGTLTEETIGIIREFWEQKSLQILPAYLATKGIADQLGANINSLFIDLLGAVQVGLEQWAPQEPETGMGGDKFGVISRTGRILGAEAAVYITPKANLDSESMEPRFVTPMAAMSSTTASVISLDETPWADSETFTFEDLTPVPAPIQETGWPWFDFDDYCFPKGLESGFLAEIPELS